MIQCSLPCWQWDILKDLKDLKFDTIQPRQHYSPTQRTRNQQISNLERFSPSANIVPQQPTTLFISKRLIAFFNAYTIKRPLLVSLQDPRVISPPSHLRNPLNYTRCSHHKIPLLINTQHSTIDFSRSNLLSHHLFMHRIDLQKATYTWCHRFRILFHHHSKTGRHYNTIIQYTYVPVSPVLIPLMWGIWMKGSLAYNRGSRSWGPKLTLLAAFITAFVWVWLTCFVYLDNAAMATRTCRMDCGKTLFSVTLTFLLVVGAWFGWQWDFGWTERQVRATEESDEKRKATIHMRKGMVI